ncbi:MAG TPA: hypothetical protein VKD67_11180, partial [Acidimicrobiales bacterium]|nr:hypothetical protein [Acidimicrobiales bacterium]
MLLAELEVWHSRPFTPTRRVALGHLVLPVEPPPGFGGILLGAVVAAHLGAVDLDLLPDLHRLVNEVERGQRVVQPRLRHRFQVDRHGLARSTHRLMGRGEDISFELENNGSPLQQVLGAVYAAERLGPTSRHAVAAVLHKAMRWRGPIGPSLISYLAGVSRARAESLMAFADPVAWALDVLGFEPGTIKPTRKEVLMRFRSNLMTVHPDHGGDEAAASKLI